MKKLLITFSAILALLLCLAIGIGASDIYSDFTKPGVNGEAPIFTCFGYAVDEDAGSICAEYTVDLDALEAYEKATGKKLNYGFVVTHSDNLVDGKPFDKNGAPINEKVLSVNLNNRTSIITILIRGLKAHHFDKEIVLSLYVKEESGLKYITEDETNQAPTLTSYNKIRGPKEVIYEEGNDTIVYSYAKPESTIAYDRYKQMNNSSKEYGSGVIDPNTYTEAKMKEILSAAKTIAGNGILGIGAKLMFPNASSFMAHYLKNTGADKIIDMGTGTNGFFKSGAGTIAHRTNRVNQALRAAETLAREGQSVSIYQQMEIVNHFGDNKEDWYLAVGSYFTCIEMHNVTVTVNADGTKTYSAQLTYKVADYYNWNENSWSTVPIVDVSQRDLHQLHREGKAKEFESTGSKTYSLTWTEGQDASTLSYK